MVNGERRLTPREMLRLQGFSDNFKIVCNDQQTRKQAGNAVPVPMIQAVIKEVLHATAEAARHKAQKKHRALPIREFSENGNLRGEPLAYGNLY
jgi:DNA (cytosine-5)-methyltransferase 1